MADEEKIDGECAIKRGYSESGLRIGLIVSEAAKQLRVREFWHDDPDRRISHWPKAEVLARAASLAEARRIVQAAKDAYAQYTPAVAEAERLLTQAKTMRLAHFHAALWSKAS